MNVLDPSILSMLGRIMRRIAIMIDVANLRRWAARAALCYAVVGPALVSNTTHAWERRPGVVVLPPAVYAPPPAVAYVAPPPVVVTRPYAHWVPGHYTRRGYWVPPHWA